MGNQNPNLPAPQQFFAVVTKGRNGLKAMVDHYGADMWKTRPSYLPDAQKEMFFQKAIMNIANDEKLNVLTASKEGLYQLMLQLTKGVQLGMVPGGIRPMFYIVPRKKYKKGGGWDGQYIATFVPTQDGLRYVVTTGKTAVFRDVLWGVVRDGFKTFEIDEVEGTVTHKYNPITTAKNEIMGIWVKCTRINKDDINVVKFISAEKILTIRDNCSAAWKTALQYNKTDSVWHIHPEEQYIKTAVKSVLKHYISNSEAMAQLAEIEAEDEKRIEDYNNQDITDRMEDRLDNVIENQNEAPIELDNVINKNEKPAEIIKENKPKKTEKKKPKKTGELF